MVGFFGNNAQSLSFRQNQESGVPNITGWTQDIWFGGNRAYGGCMFEYGGNWRIGYLQSNNGGIGSGIQINASHSSNKYKDSHDEVTPDNIAVRYYYRAF